ncbi:MAG: heme-binding protein [Clostridia bacterium]|nr:heme-binding protein [Clostridia bacterium]
MDDRKISEIVEAVVKNMPSSNLENNMTLSLAKKLALKVEEKAKEMGVNAVVAISNSGARPVLVECMDDSYIASYDVAFQKAYTVVSLKMSTSQLKKLAQPGESLYGIQFTNNGQIVIFGGGVPLKIGGKIVGGLGVSGGSEEQDTYLAEYGEQVFNELTKYMK